MYWELAGRLTVEETENDRQDTDIEGVTTDLTRIESMYRELAGRLIVEETENDRQDTDIEGMTTDLTALSETVTAFADDFSAANIRTDNITTIGFDTDIYMGASLLPTTNPIAGSVHSLGGEANQWKTVFAEDVNLDGTSLSNTLKEFLPKTEKTDFSVDKLTVPDIFKVYVTSFQDFEGEFTLEDILNYALSLMEYEHPTTVSLDRIDEATLSNCIVVNGDMIQHEPDPGNPFQTIGAPTKPWLAGHFVSVYAYNLSVSDAAGTLRRVLFEGDSVTVSYNDLNDLPGLATVATTGSYSDLTDKPPLGGCIGQTRPQGPTDEDRDSSPRPTRLV
jgi:hypothetical protein